MGAAGAGCVEMCARAAVCSSQRTSKPLAATVAPLSPAKVMGSAVCWMVADVCWPVANNNYCNAGVVDTKLKGAGTEGIERLCMYGGSGVVVVVDR